MDQNQVIDNQNVDNDLQKAIDNITNSTSIDPVFSDPIAAPSSMPEGDNGELGEPVGPFPEPKPIIASPEPITPLEPTNTPQINNFTPEQNIPTPTMPIFPNSIPEPMPTALEPTQGTPEPTISNHSEETPQNLDVHEVKKAALQDLLPVLNKAGNIDALQKFQIYHDIFEELKDYTNIESAYQAAREIPDETARAEALLYLVKIIDQM